MFYNTDPGKIPTFSNNFDGKVIQEVFVKALPTWVSVQNLECYAR